jgi:hypothetical protein
MPRGRLVLPIVVFVLATAVTGTIARAGASASVRLPPSMAGTPPLVPKEPLPRHATVVKCIEFYWSKHKLYLIHAQIRDPAHPTWSGLLGRIRGGRWEVKANSLPGTVANYSGSQAPQRVTNYIYRHHPVC